MLPLRRDREAITIWHFHLRQTLAVHYLVLRDDTVYVEQKGRQRVDLIGGEGSLSAERHGAIDVVPYRRRVRRAERQYSPQVPGSDIQPPFGFYQLGSEAPCPFRPVASHATFLHQELRAFLGGS